MATLTTVELKAFVPARDFKLSKRFYSDLGFAMPWSDDNLAYLHHGDTGFLLQKFYVKELADNFVMHLLVEDVDSWWAHVQEARVAEKYGVMSRPPQQQPWRMRDFALADPSGVLWLIAQNMP